LLHARARRADRELLASVARTSLRTKLAPEMADQFTDIVTDAVLTIYRPGEPIDLHMIERMHMVRAAAAAAAAARC
jgi:T-complex protein 1 subunit zeta